MTYVEHVLFTARCDRLGCGATFGFPDEPYPSKRGLDHDAVKHADWWVPGMSGDVHYCPDHRPEGATP